MMALLRRMGCLLLACVPFLVMMILVGAVVRNRHAVFYTIAFKDAGRLERRNRVLLDEMAVGMVFSIQPAEDGGDLVTVRLEPRDSRRVLRNATAIVRQSERPGRRPRAYVEIINPEADPLPPPLAPGSRIQGVSGELELQAWRVKSAVSEFGFSLRRAVSPFMGDEVEKEDERDQKGEMDPESKK